MSIYLSIYVYIIYLSIYLYIYISSKARRSTPSHSVVLGGLTLTPTRFACRGRRGVAPVVGCKIP